MNMMEIVFIFAKQKSRVPLLICGTQRKLHTHFILFLFGAEQPVWLTK